MALTAEQQAAVKADILANPDLNALPAGADGAWEIAALYNLEAAPAFVVWRTSIPTEEIKDALDWTELIAASVGERDSFLVMIEGGSINAAKTNIRAGIQDVFSGPGGLNTRTALVALAKRNATRIEALLATGTGSDADPATMTLEGNISYQDVLSARTS